MKYIYDTVRIRLSELHTQTVSVPAWETPVLQAVHQNDLEVIGQSEVARKRPAEAADEFTRLAQKYREPEPGQPPYVAAVYGSFGPGVGALARAINEAVIAEASAPPPAEKNDSLLASIA